MCKALKKRSKKYEKNEKSWVKKQKRRPHPKQRQPSEAAEQGRGPKRRGTRTDGGLSSGPSPNQSFQVDPHQDII